MRVGLAVAVGKGIGMIFAGLRLYPLFQVVVTPQLGKNLPGFMGEEEDLETASVRVGNQAVLPPEEQRISRLDQSVAGLQGVLALKVSSAIAFSARCQPVFGVINTDDDLPGL